MFRNRAYYAVKPWVPNRLRMALRRFHASRIRRGSGATWPILESAGRKPDGWSGWPNGARFAFVLTHDVESCRGLDRVRDLAQLDGSFGFRSSFNFIPEGSYSVPANLRHWLVSEGFEVGVHDHRHDGRLFSSRRHFKESARCINEYLKAWQVCGFRSGFMLRNLDWIRDLQIKYDSSTFDTDPFEPQPDGVGTIFPFWVPRTPSTLDPRHSTLADGYVELPYTLPQDSTLFLLLQETDTRIWREKIDWLADRGGMILVNVHPDYLAANGAPAAPNEYDAKLYTELLSYLRDRYEGAFWNPLPQEVADFVADRKATTATTVDNRELR